MLSNETTAEVKAVWERLRACDIATIAAEVSRLVALADNELKGASEEEAQEALIESGIRAVMGECAQLGELLQGVGVSGLFNAPDALVVSL